MVDSNKISRREFLRVTALFAGSAALAACGKEVTTQPAEPTKVPEKPVESTPTTGEVHVDAEPTKVSEPTPVPLVKFKEAPMLAELVAAGKLPPVEERLPETPRVAEHGWAMTGNYGGMMQLAVAFEWGLTYFPVEEFCYGSSPLQYKDDGKVIVPGTCESFEFSEDATELTLYWRKGLKWSDGMPWTTNDFMFWWDDMCLIQDGPDAPPPGLRDAKGTPAEITQVDDFTIRIKYATPTPFAIDNVAGNMKGIWNSNFYGVPTHYFKNLHPKYNTELKDFTEMQNKLFMGVNPDFPTLNAWVLKTYEEGQRVVYERNPYYYVVDLEGNQLPYLDGYTNTNYMSGEVEKLAYLEGKVDFGLFAPFGLVDVPTVKESYDKSKQQVFLWSTGTGTASGIAWNSDYYDEKYRNLINDTKFRKALSHALNREEMQKVHYLGFGELTTGTMSPKAIEFNISNDGRDWYAKWRDSALEYSPEKAMTLLDEIGVKDVDGDGLREFPDGSKMELLVEFSGTTGDLGGGLGPIEMMDRDWKAVGLNSRLNPVPPDNFRQLFDSGKGMSYGTYEVSDGPNCIIFPAHIAPSGSYGWAPLQGKYFSIKGQSNEGVDKEKDPWERNPPWREPEPDSAVDRLQKMLWQAQGEPDPLKRYQIAYDMIKIHVDEGPFFLGVVADLPQVVTVKEGLMNVPTEEDLKKYAFGGFTGPWILPCPGGYDPELFYFENPDEHKI